MTTLRAAAVLVLVASSTPSAQTVPDAESIDGLMRADYEVVSGPAGGAPDRARDEAAIRELVGRYNGAREANDPKAIEALFVADADQLVSSGEWRRGRDALVRGAMASSARTGGTRTLTVESIRMIAPDVAIADARYEISGLADGSTRRMWSTFVMARQDGAWKISAIRNMLPAPTTPQR